MSCIPVPARVVAAKLRAGAARIEDVVELGDYALLHIKVYASATPLGRLVTVEACAEPLTDAARAVLENIDYQRLPMDEYTVAEGGNTIVIMAPITALTEKLEEAHKRLRKIMEEAYREATRLHLEIETRAPAKRGSICPCQSRVSHPSSSTSRR